MTSDPANSRSIDWESLARLLGALRDGGGESGGSDLARRALAEILGREACREAVDYYVTARPGSELVRSVLWLLHPEAAMERCLEIYRQDSDLESRRTAVELLRVVADKRGLAWADEFLSDPDPGVQIWGAGLVDQVLFSRLAEPEDAAALLARMETHENTQVRERAANVREFVASRGQASPGDWRV